MSGATRTPDTMSRTVFPPVTEADWRAAAERLLKGRPLESLLRETADGIARGPLFHAGNAMGGTALPSTDAPLLEGRPWHILAPVRDPDLAHANAQLLQDLAGGASAVRICADDGEVPLRRAADLRRLLEGVYTTIIPLSFSPNARSADVAGYALELDELRSAHVHLGLDPLAHDAPNDLPDTWRPWTLAPRRAHEAGATEAEELSHLATMLAESCRWHGAEAVAGGTIVEIATTQDAHLSVAKLRAARRITRRILEAFGVSTMPLFHAVTSKRIMQSVDPWTNLLRVMSAGFGAVVGGADAVLTRPFTDGSGLATPFAHRIARNMQLLMMEESDLGRAKDAAQGSYWHEAMTEELAQAAWALFRRYERMGGVNALPSSYTEREAGPIVGVTLHPKPNDVPMPETREVET